MLFVITNKVYGMACEIIDLSIQQLKLKLCLLVKKIAKFLPRVTTSKVTGF